MNEPLPSAVTVPWPDCPARASGRGRQDEASRSRGRRIASCPSCAGATAMCREGVRQKEKGSESGAGRELARAAPARRPLAVAARSEAAYDINPVVTAPAAAERVARAPRSRKGSG